MSLEFITQPQVFTQRISALGGIEGYVPPFISTFYTWTTSTTISANSFPLSGTIGLTDIPSSYIVSVGGVLQSPTNYTINVVTRQINFDFDVNPNTDVVVTQIGTVGPGISGSLPPETSGINLNITNLLAQTGTIDNLYVTNLTAVSSVLEVVNITNYEIDGYTVNGDITVQQNANIVGNLTATDVVVTTLSTQNINIYNSFGTGNVVPATEVINVLANCVSALAVDIDGLVLYIPLLSAA